MSTSDIEDHTRDIYGLEVSDTIVSRITDKVLPVKRPNVIYENRNKFFEKTSSKNPIFRAILGISSILLCHHGL